MSAGIYAIRFRGPDGNWVAAQYGSTLDFKVRERNYRRGLERHSRAGTDYMGNARLQRMYNTALGFVFQVLDEMPEASIAELRAAEQAYIDNYRGRSWCLNRANARGFTSESAAAAGRKGGPRGGRASRASLTAEQRSAAARHAALALSRQLSPEVRASNGRKGGLMRPVEELREAGRKGAAARWSKK
jgi:hypothetical protein